MNKAREEIPDTEQGLRLYINYCDGQMKENLLHNQRLKKCMGWCKERLAKIIKVDVVL